MAKKKIKAYWLLLLTLLYTASAVLSVGQTQARYVNTISWDTLVEDMEETVTSDLLRSVTEPPVTVILGEIGPEGCTVPITFSTGTETEGVLTWDVTKPEYLSLEMSSDGTALVMAETEEEQEPIHMVAGETVTVLMKLIPAKGAFDEPRSAVPVVVTVNWGNSLTAKFWVSLEEVPEPEATEPEATEPEATEPEATEPEVTEPEATEPEETEPEATEPEATEPEATEPEVTEPEATEPEVTEPEATEPEVTEPKATEPEATEPEVTEPKDTEPEQTNPKENESRMEEPEITESEGTENMDPEQDDTAQPEDTGETAELSDDEIPEQEISENGEEPEVPDNTEEPAEMEQNTREQNETSDLQPNSETEDSEIQDENENAITGEDVVSSTASDTGIVGGLTDYLDKENNNEQEEETGDGNPADENEPSGDESGTDEPSEGPVTQVTIPVNTVECFDLTDQLPVQIHVPNGVTLMKLGMGIENMPAAEATEPAQQDNGESAELVLSRFPRFTCYSLDGGESYFMLYHAGIIELNTSPGAKISLMLDFSGTNMKGNELVLAVAGHDKNNLRGTGVSVVAVEPKPELVFSSRYLTRGEQLVIEIPEAWQAYTLDYSIEMLTCIWTEEGMPGEISYEPINPAKSGLKTSVDKTTGALILEMSDILPQAGTYRIVMSWTMEDTCVEQAQENFFINYMAYSDTVETGGAEQ